MTPDQLHIVAHDLKNPLTALKLKLQLLMRDMERNALSSNIEAIQSCLQQVTKLEELVSKIAAGS